MGLPETFAATLGPVARPDWMADGLCQEPAYSTLGWVPDKTRTPVIPAELAAICARCLVAQECLDYAVAEGINHGYWGGTSPTQRRHLHPRKDQP